jgi:hypothetical protein
LIFSCKKDNDTIPDYNSAIAGSWKYVSGMTNEKYLEVYNDHTYSILSSDAQGLHDRMDGVLQLTNNQLSIELTTDYGQVVSLFNYVKNGDSLILTKPGIRLALVKDKTAPDTTAWIKDLTIVTKTNAPVSTLTDIAYEGSTIWYGNGYASHYLYKIDATNFSVDSIPTTKYAWAVETNGPVLWVSSDGSDKVYMINKSDGGDMFSSISMGAWINGIAKDNNFLWCYSSNENTLYKYNISFNTVDLTVSIDSYWNGMAMAGGSLYVASNGKLYKLSLTPLMATESFELPGYSIAGVTYDGSSFWVSASKANNENAWPEIIKVVGVD